MLFYVSLLAEKIFDHPHEIHSSGLNDQHHSKNIEYGAHPHHQNSQTHRYRSSGFNYPSESGRKLYYHMRPNSRPRMSNGSKIVSNELKTGNTGSNSTKDNNKDMTNEKMSKSESVQEPAFMKEYGRLTEYPNPDEGLKGWKETGYKIVTEVEYSDKGT